MDIKIKNKKKIIPIKNFILKKPVSMVMVAYNEEDHIIPVISDFYNNVLRKLPKGSEYIIYLDAPSDKTPYLVKKYAKTHDIKVIYAQKNLGYAGAMTAALKRTKNDVIFYFDSSGKHIASDFWNLIRYESEYDILTGLRSPRYDPYVRRIITFFQRLLVSVMFFIPFYDFNTGYKIIHKSIVKHVLSDCKYMRQSFSSELLIRSYKKGFTIRNVPVIFKDRKIKKTGTTYGALPKIILKSARGFVNLRLELWGFKFRI
ncbi:MAG: glycosyltransferase family 2 protein [Candidatus Woesearchaeota archaeon]